MKCELQIKRRNVSCGMNTRIFCKKQMKCGNLYYLIDSNKVLPSNIFENPNVAIFIQFQSNFATLLKY